MFYRFKAQMKIRRPLNYDYCISLFMLYVDFDKRLLDIYGL